MTPALGLRQFVHLGGDHVDVHAPIHEPGPHPDVRVEPRVTAVHEQQRRRRAPPPGPEIGGGQLVEGHPGSVSTPRVAVSRQVHQEERRCPSALDPVEVRQPGLAGRGARAREAPADERVDQARFTDIRAADHGQLGQVFPRKPRRVRRAGDEGRGGRAPGHRGASTGHQGTSSPRHQRVSGAASPRNPRPPCRTTGHDEAQDSRAGPIPTIHVGRGRSRFGRERPVPVSRASAS